VTVGVEVSVAVGVKVGLSVGVEVSVGASVAVLVAAAIAGSVAVASACGATPPHELSSTALMTMMAILFMLASFMATEC
jgi:hypothetical protein